MKTTIDAMKRAMYLLDADTTGNSDFKVAAKDLSDSIHRKEKRLQQINDDFVPATYGSHGQFSNYSDWVNSGTRNGQGDAFNGN